ncbi:MAG: alpha beta-hydrolase [Lasallia pustulata]|uniref:Alpha beta-hydrolase n=1 Tax=Lasallia pustulata TaxID=136370 RepID=A0A5M8PNX1_9LECA|nr:MAG: alpha beta-hydrolase [Lasallia pustulata]
MYPWLFLISSFIAAPVLAKQCINITVPVDISARNGVFNLPTLETNTDATTFALNFTNIRGNFTEESLLGYTTVTGTYEISAKFCKPDNVTGKTPTVQFLTHGLGFDKTYWDVVYNNYNYSYTDVAVDQYGFCILAIDRLGVGNSSIADPLTVLQLPAELSAIYEITKMLRTGTLLNVPHVFDKVVHVGHSFGSVLSYTLSAMYPNITDGLILTGFSANSSFLSQFIASSDLKLGRLNQPLRFGNISYAAVTHSLAKLGNLLYNTSAVTRELAALNVSIVEALSVFRSTDLADFAAGLEASDLPHMQDLPTGYVTWTDAGSNIFNFLYPPYFDRDLGLFTERTKFPFTLGELLTSGGAPKAAPDFTGPVLVLTGNQDNIFCGGDCMATGDPALPSIPADVGIAFPAASAFEAYIQPNTGHGINVHYNATAAYRIIQEFLDTHGLAPS